MLLTIVHKVKVIILSHITPRMGGERERKFYYIVCMKRRVCMNVYVYNSPGSTNFSSPQVAKDATSDDQEIEHTISNSYTPILTSHLPFMFVVILYIKLSLLTTPQSIVGYRGSQRGKESSFCNCTCCPEVRLHPTIPHQGIPHSHFSFPAVPTGQA